MPSLIRFVVLIAVVAGAAWGGMFALAEFFEPEQREITKTIPNERLRN